MKSLLILPLLIFSSLAHGNDPLSSMQWGIKNIGQPIFRATGELTRELVRGKPGVDIAIPSDFVQSKRKVIVAVIDSGVDINHPDLKDNIWFNPKCEGMSDEDIAKTDCYGWNFLDGNPDVSDDIGHGTHVAGIIGAVKDNGIGIKGVAADNVSIMPLKILNSKVSTFVYDKKVITNIIADAIAYAVSNGAEVINLSLGWPALIHTKKIRYAIETAIKRNVAVIVAAGNNNKKLPVYPCANDEVICVGAMDNVGEVPEFSNFGGKVDIIAPGESIISTYPRGLESRTLRISGYEIKKGSSQAAPFLAGIVALLKSKNQSMSFDEIKYRLYKSAERDFSLKDVKYGKVNVEKALSLKTEKGFPLFKFKGLTEVGINEDGSVKFSLPYRALLKDISQLDFKVELEDKINGKVLYSKKFEVSNVSSEKDQAVVIDTVISNFSTSSHLGLKVYYEDKVSAHEIALVRNMLDIAEKVSVKLPFRDSEVLLSNNGRLSSSLRKVVSNKFKGQSLDYYVRRSASAGKTKIDLSRVTLSDVERIQFEIDEVGKIVSIVKNDFNNDGVEDFMVYSLSKEEKHLVLSFVTEEGRPLYGNLYQWYFEISTFEGLPFFNGDIKFDFINYDFSTFGKVKIPVFMKDWSMPEADNTLDPLDRIDENYISKKPYLLLPRIKANNVELEIRTLASVKFLEEVRKKYSLPIRDGVLFDQIVEQDEFSSTLTGLLISGREFNKRYFQIEYESVDSYQITEVDFYGLSLESNRTLVTRRNESIANASFALNTREELRAIFWDFEGNKRIQNFSTGSWGDIIIDIFDYSNRDGRDLILLESRYFIHAITGDGKSSKLPINRESSFPGVSFSETFKKVNVETKSSNARGILVDSTLIYGDRIYSMVQDGDVFSSPIYASFSLPKSCKYLDVAEFEGVGHIVVACHDRFLRSTIELIPLKESIK
ncbi:S8 family peptidase [Halobacteriovorax marinus]|uniref:S8 family peptidase n=1 Tax=Halobacteriovorax marinus TaxID=97084 RepID=UPI003A920DAA